MIRDTGQDDRLPRIPPLTAEQLQANDEAQAKLARNISIASSASHREFANAHAVIKSYEEYGIANLPPPAREKYVEALATVGRYEEAYFISRDKKYQELNNVLCGQNKPCTCEDTKDVTLVDGQPVSKPHSRFFILKKVYSLADATWHDIKVCNKCGVMTL